MFRQKLNEAEIKVSLLASRVEGRRVRNWADHKFSLLYFPGTAITTVLPLAFWD